MKKQWIWLLALVGILLGIGLPGYAVYVATSYDNASLSPGPPPPWGAGHSGPGSRSGFQDGMLAQVVNTYTGNLTLEVKPISYQSPGEAIPFVIYYNSRSWGGGRAKAPLGAGWTHSYNVYIVPRDERGVWLVEGNGWVRFFTHNATGNAYVAPKGVREELQDSADGGWVLRRPDQHRLYFDRRGKLTRIEDKQGLAWTLSYDQAGRLTGIADPDGGKITMDYTEYPGIVSGYLLTRVTASNGDQAEFSYDVAGFPGRGPVEIIDTRGEKYRLGYEGDRIISLTDSKGREFRYRYEGDENGDPRIVSISASGQPDAIVTYHYRNHPVSSEQRELLVDIQEPPAPAKEAVIRHVYDNSGGPRSNFGALLKEIQNPDDSAHAKVISDWVYDSQLHRRASPQAK